MPFPEAVSWSGTVVDGGLRIGDWPSWRGGRFEQRDVPDLAACLQAIEGGRCVGSLAPAAALPLSLTAALFRLAMRRPADAPGEDLDEDLDAVARCCGACLDEPLIAWALRRLRDTCDAHLYALTARALAARLFMEARRIHRELIQREERLIAHLCEQAPEGCCLLPGEGVCYGAGTGLLAAALAVDDGRLSLAAEPHAAVLDAVGVPEGRRRAAIGEAPLVVVPHAIDGAGMAQFDAVSAGFLNDHRARGGRWWVLVPGYAVAERCRSVSDRVSVAIAGAERLLTETAVHEPPAAVLDAPFVGLQSPSCMQ